MAARWRGCSLQDYENCEGCPAAFYACGEAPWGLLSSLGQRGEGQTEAGQVFLCSPTNLSAVREAVVQWWAAGDSDETNTPEQRQQQSLRLILLPVTPSADRLRTDTRNTVVENRAVGSTYETDDPLSAASADEIVCALLLYQLMQQAEIELPEDDSFGIRGMLRSVVTAASAAAQAGGADADGGWERIEGQLRRALQHSDLELDGELHFQFADFEPC